MTIVIKHRDTSHTRYVGSQVRRASRRAKFCRCNLNGAVNNRVTVYASLRIHLYDDFSGRASDDTAARLDSQTVWKRDKGTVVRGNLVIIFHEIFTYLEISGIVLSHVVIARKRYTYADGAPVTRL